MWCTHILVAVTVPLALQDGGIRRARIPSRHCRRGPNSLAVDHFEVTISQVGAHPKDYRMSTLNLFSPSGCCSWENAVLVYSIAHDPVLRATPEWTKVIEQSWLAPQKLDGISNSRPRSVPVLSSALHGFRVLGVDFVWQLCLWCLCPAWVWGLSFGFQHTLLVTDSNVTSRQNRNGWKHLVADMASFWGITPHVIQILIWTNIWMHLGQLLCNFHIFPR